MEFWSGSHCETWKAPYWISKLWEEFPSNVTTPHGQNFKGFAEVILELQGKCWCNTVKQLSAVTDELRYSILLEHYCWLPIVIILSIQQTMQVWNSLVAVSAITFYSFQLLSFGQRGWPFVNLQIWTSKDLILIWEPSQLSVNHHVYANRLINSYIWLETF